MDRFLDSMSYNQQYVLAAQMQHANAQVVQQQQQTIAEQQHQAAAALELASTANTPAPPQAHVPAPNHNALAIRRPFDPTAHELDANFRLTRFADLKG